MVPKTLVSLGSSRTLMAGTGPVSMASLLGHGLAREGSGARRRLIEEGRHDRRGLHQVLALQAIVHVEVRMPRPGAVFDVVLDELEGREPDRVEDLVVRLARVAHGEGRDAQVGE